MPVPTYQDLITPSSTANGLLAESVEERILTLFAMLVSGTAPDGTALTTVIGAGPLVLSNGLAVGAIQAKSAAYPMLATDFGTFVTTGASTLAVTLKSTNGAGTLQFIQKVDAGAGAVTVTPDVGNIEGVATKSLAAQNASVLCCFDGTNWHVIAANAGAIV